MHRYMMPEKKKKKVVALMCLQAQHVAGLPAAAEGSQVVLRLVHHHQQQQQQETAAAARCRAGVAAFHEQVLLLHCAPVDRINSVSVSVSFHDCCYSKAIDLATQLHRSSPRVLSFVLGAGTVLSLTLHHRLLIRHPHPCCSACLPVPNFLRTDPSVIKEDDDDGQSSSGFITIEKGTISRRRPPSDNLLTTDDDEEGAGSKPTSCYPMALAEELEVENEFLAKLEADRDIDLDLDALIKDVEADLAELYL